jgi:hypothetical protein
MLAAIGQHDDDCFAGHLWSRANFECGGECLTGRNPDDEAFQRVASRAVRRAVS